MAKRWLQNMLLSCLGAAFLTPGTAWSGAGTEGASFLNIPIGAGPGALGGAYVSQAEDAYAPVYNPAGLGFLPSTQIAGQHLAYLESINYEYLSMVHPFKERGGIGFAVQYLNTGDIPRTDLNGNRLGDFSSYYAAYTLGYGVNVTERLCLGASLKTIRARLADTSASAYGVDLGSLYRVNDSFTVGGTLTNIGNSLTFVDQNDPLPLSFKLGGNYWFGYRWNVGMEAAMRRSGVSSVHSSIEWRPIDLFSLRTGYRTDTTKELSPLAGFTLGMGMNLWGQEFSYAWLPMGDLGNTQYFSLVVRFWELDVPHPRRNLIRYRSINGLVKATPSVTLSEPEFILPDANEHDVAEKFMPEVTR